MPGSDGCSAAADAAAEHSRTNENGPESLAGLWPVLLDYAKSCQREVFVSKRIAWRTMERLYRGRKYRGRQKGKQITFLVVDTTLGGDVIIRRRGYSDTTMKQGEFMEFVSRAKDITER